MSVDSEAEILSKLQSKYDELNATYKGGISNTSRKKFDEMRSYLAEQLGLAEDDVYFTGAGTRVANLEVRLSQGVQATKSTVLAVGVFISDPGKLTQTAESGMKTCEKFLGQGRANYEAILLLGDEGGRLAFGGAIVREGSSTSRTLASRLPSVLNRKVADDDPEATPPRIARVPEAAGPRDPIGELEPESIEFIREVGESALHCHNVILQGPPGTGKTFLARSVAEVIIASSPSGQGDFQEVQFHQAYSYEDFVQGFRPAQEGGYRLQPGVFFELCETAAEDPTQNFVMLVDEINRGNVSQILGELMSLIETDKRDPAFAKRLLYSSSEQDSFYVPPNVYVIGMMNTADRSLAIVDFALRRRFRFYDVDPEFGEEFVRLAIKRGVPETLARKVGSRCKQLNERIAADRRFLGPGHRIGHAYFLPSRPPADAEAWYRAVISAQIAPLLSEYWHDRPEVAVEEVEALLA
jgi:MoxR-like ATPase